MARIVAGAGRRDGLTVPPRPHLQQALTQGGDLGRGTGRALRLTASFLEQHVRGGGVICIYVNRSQWPGLAECDRGVRVVRFSESEDIRAWALNKEKPWANPVLRVGYT